LGAGGIDVPNPEGQGEVVAGRIVHGGQALELTLGLGHLQGGLVSQGAVPHRLAVLILDELGHAPQGGGIGHILQLIAHGIELTHIDGQARHPHEHKEAQGDDDGRGAAGVVSKAAFVSHVEPPEA
jgi:hypothetical protein